MHEKTRYNIRLAQKHGVKARLIEQPDYARRVFPFFWNLLQETAKRQRIRTHPRSYYEQMVNVLVPRGVVKLLLAEHDGAIVAVHLLAVFGDTVSYLHGGSSYEHRALMGPHLLHREGVRLAKRFGKMFYNLGGVAPAGYTDHRWATLTRFKEGFGTLGETAVRFTYPGAFDLVFSSLWYTMYTAARAVRGYMGAGRLTSNRSDTD
jgi:lipid II:glycine glycyltransferase (peptidoglycan interpeptide bridge formation enzyme)